MATTTTEPVVLILADISGYTRFMVANRESIVHGQQVITELLETLIGEVDIPLEIKELEGDAIFLYARKLSHSDARWEETRRTIGAKLLRFFEAFTAKIAEASESALCPCAICQNLGELKLKIVVHSGEALFHHIGQFPDVSGPDVILVHKLLKNSVAGDEYVLMTEAGRRDVQFPEGSGVHHVDRGEELVEEFGRVPTYVAYLEDHLRVGAQEPIARFHTGSALGVWTTGLRWLFKSGLGSLPILLGLRPQLELDALPEARLSGRQRWALLLQKLVTTPVEFVVGAVTLGRRARQRRVPA